MSKITWLKAAQLRSNGVILSAGRNGDTEYEDEELTKLVTEQHMHFEKFNSLDKILFEKANEQLQKSQQQN